ncbi:MAG: carbohydrate porin [Oscillatoriales cyanobacterium C42_A2020_001]|nr:carbohydrate porin [Leptolyngbyaceae cyanobacterium C42_A2020_001]
MKKIGIAKQVSPVLLLSALGFLMANPLGVKASAVEPVAEAKEMGAIAQTLPTDATALDEISGVAELDPISNTATSSNLDQVTSVSQLTDVKPTDWAYQALQSLVERYGCIVGYPDKTFRGNRALSRYEFAAGLNACLDKVQELIAASTADFARKEDLDKLKRMVEEFAPELAALRGRMEALEVRTTTLEKQQFSTTTKLFGQVILGVQGRNSPDIELAGFQFNDNSDQINVITNVQLSLFTAFSERSLLFTGLQAGSGRSYSQLLTNNVLLGYEGDTANSVQLSDLTFRHLFGNNFAIVAGAEGVNMVNVFRGSNRIESAGQGPLSFFAQRNPILNLGSSGGSGTNAGLGFDWQIGPRFSLQGVYFTNRPEDPANGGLFGGENGGTTVGAQLTIAPTDTIDIALSYANSYSPSGFLGIGTGDDQVALPTSVAPFVRAPIQTNAFGGTISWRVSPRITIGGWAGYTNSELKGTSGNVKTINWMAFLNLPDLFGAGHLGGIYVGQPPAIFQSDLPLGRNVPDFASNGNVFASGEGGQPGRTTHVEAFYRYRVNDNISVTPGVIVIFNPNNNPDNDTITIGVLRTTFTF